MLDRIASWLFRRFRRRYLGVLETLCVLFLAGGVCSLAVVSVMFYFRRSASEALIVDVIAASVVTLGIRLGVASQHERLAPARAWFRGEDVEAELAWQRLIVMIGPVAAWALALQTPVHMVLTLGVMNRYTHFGLAGLLGTEIALLGVLAGGSIIILQGYQVLIRPALVALAAEMPTIPTLPRSGLSIASRLTIGVVAASAVSSAGAIAWSGQTSNVAGRWLVAGVAAVIVTAYVTSLFRIGLIDAALAPLRDIAAATNRVRAGNFGTPIVITSADELGDLAAAFNEMQRGLRERESLRSAFGSYVDPALAERLLDEGTSVFEGEEIDVTVFFADIRDFTGYAERSSAREAVSSLNRFFSIVVRVISEYGGHTNAYLGDGVLGVFGTPLPLDDHADRAVAAALAIRDAVWREFEGLLRIGIGINTGRVIAGTVGGEGKLEFTVIGDPVNVAARVEQLTKQTGDAVLMTAATCAALTRAPQDLLERGEFDVRGKQSRVRLFSVG